MASAVGGVLPVPTEELAQRAYNYHLNPLRSPLKAVLDAHPSVAETPPLMGIFNDIPAHLMREDEVQAWARAGFSFIVADGEHSLGEGRLGRDQVRMCQRAGLTVIQRLHREAVSEHGDSLTLGCRATMRPYGTSVAEAAEYLEAVKYPTPGSPSPSSRGGFPMRGGDRQMYFTPTSLREAEQPHTQAWVQFETDEYIREGPIRDGVIAQMAAEGRNKACGFVGPFDAILRGGEGQKDGQKSMAEEIDNLIAYAATKGVHMGRVCGSGTCSEPEAIEEAMVAAIQNGSRLICSHYLTSDMTFTGAKAMTAPFFKAAERCGFGASAPRPKL